MSYVENLAEILVKFSQKILQLIYSTPWFINFFSVNFKNFYSTNDLTIISADHVDNDELIEYVIENQIDLIITLNIRPQSFKDNFKKLKLANLTEKPLDNSNIKELSLKKISFKIMVILTDIFTVILEKNFSSRRVCISMFPMGELS